VNVGHKAKTYYPLFHLWVFGLFKDCPVSGSILAGFFLLYYTRLKGFLSILRTFFGNRNSWPVSGETMKKPILGIGYPLVWVKQQSINKHNLKVLYFFPIVWHTRADVYNRCQHISVLFIPLVSIAVFLIIHLSTIFCQGSFGRFFEKVFRFCLLIP